MDESDDKFLTILGKYNNLKRTPDPNNATPTNKGDTNYRNIWQDILPSLKNMDEKTVYPRLVSIAGIYLVIFITLTLITWNLVFGIGIASLIITGFIFIFHSELFHLKALFRSNPFSLFKDTIFWQENTNPCNLYVTNSKDNTTTGLRIFQFKQLAENVRPNLNQLKKALINTNIKVPFTYQIVKRLKSNSNSFEICLYMVFFHQIVGTLTQNKLAEINTKLIQYSICIEGAKLPNVRHVNFELLQTVDLINAFRSTFLHISDPSQVAVEYVPHTPGSLGELFVKTCTLLGLSIFISILSLAYGVPELLRFLIGVGSFLGLSAIWNRQLYTFRFRSSFFRNSAIQTCDPFFDVQFFRFRSFPSTIFYHLNKSVFGGIKISNLHYVLATPYCKPEKFYDAITMSSIPYSITYQLTPINLKKVEKYAFPNMKELEKQYFLRCVQNDIASYNWYHMRDGMWDTILTLSTHYSMLCYHINKDIINTIESKLFFQQQEVTIAFGQNYANYKTIELRHIKLEYGLMFDLLKQNKLRRGGTYLNCSIFQGTMVAQLITIADIFKKGVESRIGAEFNSPLHLENFITIGNTINTEILKEECGAGFTLEQLHSLLITNGTQESRDLTAMHIISELVQQGYPAIIFDTTGIWSRLLTLYQGTQFVNQLLYFKMKRTLILNPLISDVPYDKDNVRYLDFMLDAYALCYKQDNRARELFRNSIFSEVSDGQIAKDIQTLRLDLNARESYERSPITDSVLQFFEEFVPQEFSLRGELPPIKTTPSYEFITSDKTIIIDLSEILNRDTQCFYILFILAKLIHFIHVGEQFLSKFIVFPNIDMVFENYYLNQNRMYDRITKFLHPLIEADFGFIATTPQLYLLHENVFDYFSNIMAFKTIDKRDFAAMSNLMGLESMHGKGVYSSARKESFQMKYMSEMKPNEAVVKREDIYQPFPIRVHFETLQKTEIMSWDRLLEYMTQQGFSVEDIEQQLLARTRTTLLQKDFGFYASLTKEIIHFLENLKKVDKVGNATRLDLSKQLFEYLYPKIMTITKSRAQMNKIRDEIFTILIKQRYLVEAHPKRAGGGESMHTTYTVGPYFSHAINDYHNTLKMQGAKLDVEVSDAQTKSKPILLKDEKLVNITDNDKEIDPQTTPLSSLDLKALKQVLAAHFGGLFYYKVYQLQSFIEQEQFETAIHVAQHAFPSFIYTVCKAYHNFYDPSRNEVLTFLNELTLLDEFPCTYLELHTFLEFCEAIFTPQGTKPELNAYCQEVFSRYLTVFTKLNHYIGV